MKSFRLPQAALLFTTVLCACSFAGAQENPQLPKQTIQVSALFEPVCDAVDGERATRGKTAAIAESTERAKSVLRARS